MGVGRRDGPQRHTGTCWGGKIVCILSEVVFTRLCKFFKIHRINTPKRWILLYVNYTWKKQNQNKYSCFLCWELDVPAYAHTWVKRLYFLCFCWFLLFFRGVKIRWLCCFGKESHFHGKGRERTWLENSNTSLLFVGLVQGSTNCAPRAKSSPPPVFVNKVPLEHSHARLFTLSMAALNYRAELSGCSRDRTACKA